MAAPVGRRGAFTVHTQYREGGAFVLVSGEFDLANADTVTAALRAAELRCSGLVLLGPLQESRSWTPPASAR